MTATGPTTARGHAAGLGSTDGLPFDPSEYTPALSWPLNIAVYDRMRRQDAKVKSIYNAVTLPIRRSPWHLDPNGAADEVVELIAEDLGIPVLDAEPKPRRRSRQRVAWADHVRLACLSLLYGHMPFEKVGEVVDGAWRLRALRERLPSTLAKINTDRQGELQSVEQYPSAFRGDAGPGIVIPAPALLFYSHEREGGLWQGNSILRTAYRHWLVKDRLIRVDAMKHERNGLGVPSIEAPPNASDKMIQDLNDIASRFRAGETAGMAVPAGAKLRLVGVEGNTPDTLASIRYHDEQIGEEMLAQFLDLGTTETGSRALGAAFIDFFVMALQAIADELAETANEQLIEPWVDWNFGEDEAAPRLVAGDPGADHSVTAEAIAGLVQSGVLVADEPLEDWIREGYRMPKRDANRPAPTPPPAPALPPGPGAEADRRRLPFSHGATLARIDEVAPAGWPHPERMERIAAAYGELLADAMLAAFDVEAYAEAYISNRVEAAAPELTPELAGLIDELRRLWSDAYVAGTAAADELLADAGITIRARPWDTAIDWTAWEPGNAAAAAEVAGRDGGRGLARLLADADVTIRGVEDTTLDRIARALADGLDRGAGVEEVGRELRDIVGNKVRARMIAQTEMARAMTVASLDSYAEHGVTARRWLLSVGACPLCVENERTGAVELAEAFPNGDPPVHPHCVCAVAPVIDEVDHPLDAPPEGTVDEATELQEET